MTVRYYGVLHPCWAIPVDLAIALLEASGGVGSGYAVRIAWEHWIGIIGNTEVARTHQWTVKRDEWTMPEQPIDDGSGPEGIGVMISCQSVQQRREHTGARRIRCSQGTGTVVQWRMQETQRREWIVRTIRTICRGPQNRLGTSPDEPAWGEPLVGFASGADPIFTAYKRHVGPEHWTPYEIFHATFPEVAARPEELAVVSWVLPQTERTKADNRMQTRMPAERWARARIAGEAFNNHLRTSLAELLTRSGMPAVAPMCSQLWRRTDSQAFTYASTWSERHAAYAAGLGTFGLCDGLITPVGKAMRTGSVVVHARLPATPRPYTRHQEYCLYFSEGTCGECIPRCPAGALSETGHDKVACGAYVNETRNYVRSELGFEGYGCGLCQTGVACESRIPARGRRM